MMLVVLNHKNYLSYSKACIYVKTLSQLTTTHNLIVCPNSCYLSLFAGNTLGAQDVSCYPLGAYTGEIAASTLLEMGVSYVLINHSERLIKMNETLEMSKKKLEQAIHNQLIPIICIGETKEEHEHGKYLEKILQNLDFLLRDIDKDKEFIIAYEPIFAIGTGIVPSKEEVEQVTTKLKDTYHKRILYGGSVNDKNVGEFASLNSIDGLLLGSISIDLEALQRILEQL